MTDNARTDAIPRFARSPYALERAFARHDTSAPGHKDRVAVYAGQLAIAAGLDGLSAHRIAGATRRHDVGKLIVPLDILAKPGRLSADEVAAVRMHAPCGGELLARANAAPLEIEIARHHHERWDGLGYPDGLAGTRIPLAARLVAVADVFDALTAHRPYKPGLPALTALNIMTGDMATAFDPRLLETFAARVAPSFAPEPAVA